MTDLPPDELVVFSEEQRFRQAWIRILVAFVAAVAWYTFIVQVVGGEPVGNNPADDVLVVIILAVFGIIFPIWFIIMRLETQVTLTALRFRMFPLHRAWRVHPFDTIARAVAITYRPLREYGGWGIRFGRRGMAYNVSGNEGVLITLRSGTSFLLGSLRAAELEQVLTSRIR